MGTEGAQPEKLPEADDLHLICYTSGTTGEPPNLSFVCRLLYFKKYLLKLKEGNCYSFVLSSFLFSDLGRAKGVMITHRMVVSVIAGFEMDLREVVRVILYLFIYIYISIIYDGLMLVAFVFRTEE